MAKFYNRQNYSYFFVIFITSLTGSLTVLKLQRFFPTASDAPTIPRFTPTVTFWTMPVTSNPMIAEASTSAWKANTHPSPDAPRELFSTTLASTAMPPKMFPDGKDFQADLFILRIYSYKSSLFIT